MKINPRGVICLAFSFPLLLGLHSAWAMTSRVGSAQDLGVGAAAGQPFGVTAKYWDSSTTAIDAFMGYHFHSNLDVHADYLWHTYSSFDVSRGRLPFYFGLGGRFLLGKDSQLGMRFPFGATYLTASDPMEYFVELAPVMRMTGGIGFDMDGIVGFRLYLNYLK